MRRRYHWWCVRWTRIDGDCWLGTNSDLVFQQHLSKSFPGPLLALIDAYEAADHIGRTKAERAELIRTAIIQRGQ